MISLDEQNKILQLLSEKGYRINCQRREVLNVLFEHDDTHMTAEEIYEYAKKNSEKISIATVYRTVQLLEQVKVLLRIEMNDKCSHYELVHSGEKQEHPHFICTKCGKTIGIHDDLVMLLLNDCQNAICSNYSVDVDKQNILYYGLCAECRKNSKIA